MAYKKPVVVAKSAPKQSFVAGGPPKSFLRYCSDLNDPCRVGPLK